MIMLNNYDLFSCSKATMIRLDNYNIFPCTIVDLQLNSSYWSRGLGAGHRSD